MSISKLTDTVHSVADTPILSVEQFSIRAKMQIPGSKTIAATHRASTGTTRTITLAEPHGLALGDYCLPGNFGNAAYNPASSYGLIESWQPLANFTSSGLEWQFDAHGVWWTYPLLLGPVWSCAWLGEYGAWETWANLANGAVGSQWTGTQNIFSPDIGHQGLVTWYATEWT